MTREIDHYRADPLVGHVHLPNARREFDWQEHPRGEIVFRTNNLGFREDTDLGATIIVLLLPSKLDVESNPGDRVDAAGTLKLDKDQLRIDQTIAERLKVRLQRAGIPFIDLLPLMQGRSNLYWEQDHHFSLDGHRLIAELLATEASSSFDEAGPTSD